jgi:CheY-like chemotaxis protein
MRHQLNLLFVEPSLTERVVLRGHLERLKYFADFAWNIETALVQANSKAYDFILIDDSFNRIESCSELTVSLSESKLNQETPIVFLSSSGNFEKSKTDQHHKFAKPRREEDVSKLIGFLFQLKQFPT